MLASSLSRLALARANADIGAVFLTTWSAGRMGLSGNAGRFILLVGPTYEVPRRFGRGGTTFDVDSDREAEVEAFVFCCPQSLDVQVMSSIL